MSSLRPRIGEAKALRLLALVIALGAHVLKQTPEARLRGAELRLRAALAVERDKSAPSGRA